MAWAQREPAKGKRELKIAVVGSGGVGKSALTIRFVTSQFYDTGYNPTIEDSYRKQVVVNEEAVTLEILDTAGQEEYGAMAAQWYKYAQGFLLVYSITDRVSYENLLLLHQDILRVKDRPSVPVIVVSNKCDLASQRMVGQIEGRDLARSFGAPFIECSAAEGVNVDVAFRQLVKLVRKDERRIAAQHEQILAGPVSGPGVSSTPTPKYTGYPASGSAQLATRRPSSPVQPFTPSTGLKKEGGEKVGKGGCCVVM